MHILAKMEGISVEPAAAVAFSGLIKMVRAGEIDPNAVIVVNCTGHTMPIEVEILGEGWGREVALPVMQAGSGVPSKTGLTGDSEQEGLLAALSRVTR